LPRSDRGGPGHYRVCDRLAGGRRTTGRLAAHGWLALAVLFALTNAFVCRDGYTAWYDGLMLSALVVVVLVFDALVARALTIAIVWI